ncbi:MAG: alpha-(1-_3)-arabinofuranosyltransferase family protein [Actinomycetes bacterium]
MIKWLRQRYDIATLTVLAFIPLLLSAPGKLPADTKLYLYLNPGRLLSDAAWTWDSRQLGGWVPHQNVGYLWPTGPWFSFFNWLSIPDWIAHRLWLGTLLIIAGLGTRWLVKHLGLSRSAQFIAALCYQLSPFVLPYISRTSALLLPWSLLPWIIGLTLLMIKERRWQYFAIFGLLIASSGGLNATALLMIAPAPLVWLIDAYVRRAMRGRQILSIVGLLGAITAVMSAWWIAGLSTQGKYGAPVLSYSEALTSTSATSSAPEVLRGLGYWIFYDRNDVTALTSASTPYQTNLFVIGCGLLILFFGLLGIITHQRLRRPLSLMLLVGVVASVGAYPSNSPAPLWSYFADHPKSAISLALRSSSRAVPLVALAVAIGLGIIIQHLIVRFAPRSTRTPFFLVATATLMLCVNMPALFGGRLIDPAISRPENIPSAWGEAADLLNARYELGDTGSVLILPGIESAAYRWGYPVDPILPGITKKPLITRDWLPLGSAPYMDLLYALDDSFQNGTADPDSIAPIARLLGADTVMVVNSYQYERFGLNRPERSSSLIASAPGLTHLGDFGDPTVNLAQGIDALDLHDFPATALPEISLYSVDDSEPGLRISHAPLLVSGDGSGVVDLASTGLIDGRSTILASAALDQNSLDQALSTTPELFVTDGNRRRAHHWRSSQDVWGATEDEYPVIDGLDVFDNRLPVFPLANNRPETQSTAMNTTGIRLSATAYGAFLSYLPEYRPSNANDGNLATSWSVGWGVNPVGQILTIASEQTNLDKLALIATPHTVQERAITDISISVNGSAWKPQSLQSDVGTQTISLAQLGHVVRLRIDAVSNADEPNAVGWIEVLPEALRSEEIITVPSDASSRASANTAVSYVFTRLRSDPYDARRQDPELSINRQFLLAHDASFILTASVALTTSDLPVDTCVDDLVTIDGISVPMSAEDSGDAQILLTACSPLTLPGGEHQLRTPTPSGIKINNVILRSTLSAPAQPSTIAPITQTRSTRSANIPECSSDCWIEMPEGWNVGWSASVGGRQLPVSVASGGGHAVWFLPATSATDIKFNASWTPQRRMWIGIAVTLMAILCSLIVLLRPRLRRRIFLSTNPVTERAHKTMHDQKQTIVLITMILATGVLGALVISPAWGIAMAVLWAMLHRYPHLIRSVGVSLVTLSMLYLLIQQKRYGFAAGFDWPSHFRRVHRPAMGGLVLIFLGSWARSDEPAGEHMQNPASVSQS